MFSPARSYAHAAEEVGKAVEVKGCCEDECWRVPKTYKTSIYHIRSAHLSCLSLSVCVSCYNEVSCRVPDLYTCTLYINLGSVVSSYIQKQGALGPYYGRWLWAGLGTGAIIDGYIPLPINSIFYATSPQCDEQKTM